MQHQSTISADIRALQWVLVLIDTILKGVPVLLSFYLKVVLAKLMCLIKFSHSKTGARWYFSIKNCAHCTETVRNKGLIRVYHLTFCPGDP